MVYKISNLNMNFSVSNLLLLIADNRMGDAIIPILHKYKAFEC